MSFEPFLAFFSGIQLAFESNEHFFFFIELLKQLILQVHVSDIYCLGNEKLRFKFEIRAE
jgi:hypothetical protein